MVDVSTKKVTQRQAVASAEVRLKPATLKLIHNGKIPKGDVFAVARLAGIQAAKETSRLIPLCHPLPLDHVELEIVAKPPGRVVVRAEAAVDGKTGVEMEALVAVSIAALTVYDMCKAVDRGIEIGPVRLDEKAGGRSGTWKRSKRTKRG